MIKLTKTQREEAIASLQTYARENMAEPIGDLAAGNLIDFFFEELGPFAYNQGVADAQQRLQPVLAELDVDVHQVPLQYWPNQRLKKKRI